MHDADRASVSEACIPVPPETTITDAFGLIAYAREHRYRVRNIHDSDLVPPARRMKPGRKTTPAAQAGYVGKDDRCDVIVGYDGYLADEGESRLGVFLQYRSARGVKKAETRIRALGGQVTQFGDTEIAGNIPVDRIEDVLKLIRVSKVPMRNPNPTFGTVSGARTRARID